MHRFRKLLVGVDLSSADRMAAAGLSEPTKQAIERAIWLAERVSGEVTFLAAMELSARAEELLPAEDVLTEHSVRDDATAVLDELVAQAQAAGVTAQRVLTIGTPWEEVIKEVLRNGYDLVIVGTRNRSRAGRLLFGSTGLKLMRCCPCPVWITRPDPNPEEVRILVASDLGPVAENALHIAVDAAQATDAKVYLVHAFEDPFANALWRTGLSMEKIHAARDKEKAEVERQLHEQLAATDYRTLKHGVQVHVIDGPPDTVILDAIDQFEIDLLMMGTVARGGIPGLLIGNTAERLMMQVNCSVLAIKPADFVCPVSID